MKEEEKQIKEIRVSKHITLNEKSVEILNNAQKEFKLNNNIDLSWSALIDQALFSWGGETYGRKK